MNEPIYPYHNTHHRIEKSIGWRSFQNLSLLFIIIYAKLAIFYPHTTPVQNCVHKTPSLVFISFCLGFGTLVSVSFFPYPFLHVFHEKDERTKKHKSFCSFVQRKKRLLRVRAKTAIAVLLPEENWNQLQSSYKRFFFFFFSWEPSVSHRLCFCVLLDKLQKKYKLLTLANYVTYISAKVICMTS